MRLYSLTVYTQPSLYLLDWNIRICQVVENVSEGADCDNVFVLSEPSVSVKLYTPLLHTSRFCDCCMLHEAIFYYVNHLASSSSQVPVCMCVSLYRCVCGKLKCNSPNELTRKFW